jgi:class 3 adenylate cyclase
MLSHLPHHLLYLERRLRTLLPADLYASVWIDPNADNLVKVFEHLRTLHHILNDYTPQQVSDHPPAPGEIRHSWQEGTLLFTDLAGFTPLLEASAIKGQQGAFALLTILNQYFASMIEIIAKSGGDLLEFTGDAMLVQFLARKDGNDLKKAVRAGLRMQRAMAAFAQVETNHQSFSLGMRVGIHRGQFLAADIGTPMRMARVLLGHTVQRAKCIEASGDIGRVCLPLELGHSLGDEFQVEPVSDHCGLVQDGFTADQLGEYDLTLRRRRQPGMVLFDRSQDALIAEISNRIDRIEPLVSYLPGPILRLLVEQAAERRVPPGFPDGIVLFINLLGLTEAVDDATPEEVNQVVTGFSRLFATINAAISSRGGILQKVTYQSVGSDILAYFGILNPHTDDARRAADAAIAIRQIVAELPRPVVGGTPVEVACRIGMTRGAVFSAEIGEVRGRREFNILGDPVNTAARLMTRAAPQQIWVTEAVREAIAPYFPCPPIGEIPLKGKAAPVPIFSLENSSSYQKYKRM